MRKYMALTFLLVLSSAAQAEVVLNETEYVPTAYNLLSSGAVMTNVSCYPPPDHTLQKLMTWVHTVQNKTSGEIASITVYRIAVNGQWTYYFKLYTVLDLSSGSLAPDLQAALDLLDFDGDGYSDAYELTNGMDYLVNDAAPDPTTDTDGDGFPDWMETQLGTDPEDANDTPEDADGDGWPVGLDLDDNDDSIHPPAGWHPDYEPESDGDLDDDGIPDEQDNDMDGDGINNDDELFLGGDPWDGTSHNKDTDGDGYSDNWEKLAGTNPNSPDSKPFHEGDGVGWTTYDDAAGKYADNDNDGIVNCIEIYYGTDPEDENSVPIDTDQDGFPDVAENEYGSDPTNGSNHPPYGNGYGGPIGGVSEGVEVPRGPWVPDPDWKPPVTPETNYEEDPEDPPDPVVPDAPEDVTPTVEPDDDVTQLTREDIAAAVQAALKGTQGSLSDAVESGVWRGTQDLDHEVTEGINNSLDGIETAVGRALEKVSWSSSNAGPSPGKDAFDVGEKSADSKSKLQSVSDGLGVGSQVNFLKPTAQSNYSVEFDLPTQFVVGSKQTSLANSGDYSFTLSTIPDTSTETGAVLNSLRLLVRTFLMLLIMWRFSRSVMKVLFKIT